MSSTGYAQAELELKRKGASVYSAMDFSPVASGVGGVAAGVSMSFSLCSKNPIHMRKLGQLSDATFVGDSFSELQGYVAVHWNYNPIIAVKGCWATIVRLARHRPIHVQCKNQMFSPSCLVEQASCHLLHLKMSMHACPCYGICFTPCKFMMPALFLLTHAYFFLRMHFA